MLPSLPQHQAQLSSAPTTNLLRTFSPANGATRLPVHVQRALASSICVGTVPCIGRLLRHGVVECRDIAGVDEGRVDTRVISVVGGEDASY